MKKLILTALSAIMAIGVWAASLTPDEALARLSDGRLNAPAVKPGALRLIREGSYKGLPSYYVFSDGVRSLILSADDLAVPVLGYLDRPVSADTPMPPQLIWWLDQAAESVSRAEALGITPAASPMTTSPARSPKEYVSPLIKTTWNQDAPFNNLCPQGTPSGCVATAMAQVLKYYNYPEFGTGNVSTVYNNRTLSMNLDETRFDWVNMLDSYNDYYTTSEADAVATLMKACGYSVQMQYEPEGSGAASQDIAGALVNNFNYDKGTSFLYRDYYSPDDWENIIYGELSSGRPVLYSGTGGEGGHAFVCDGYNDSEGFHFNWGWGGAYDGFFTLDALEPAGQGIGGNGVGFNENQRAVVGIQKPVAGSKAAQPYIVAYGDGIYGESSDRAVYIGCENGGFYNMSAYDGVFDIAFILANNSNGTEYTTFVYEEVEIGKLYGTDVLAAWIENSVPNGTYTLTPVYRISGTLQWQKILIPYRTPTTITVTLSAMGISVDVKIGSQEPEPEPEPDPSSLELTYGKAATTTGFVVNSTADLSVDITNSNKVDISREISMMILDENFNILSYGDFTNVTVKAGETVNYTFYCPIDDITPGEYICALVNDDFSMEKGWWIDVEANTIESLIPLSYRTPTGFTRGEPCELSIELQNPNRSDVDTTVECHIGSFDGQYYYVEFSFGGREVSCPANSTVSVDYSAVISETLDAGDYYLIIVEDGEIIGRAEISVVNSTLGIDSPTVSDNSDAEYYDLQGHRYDTMPTTPGIYISVSNGQTRKIIVR